MSQHQIFGPMFALLFLTFVVWVYMYAKRLTFIRSSGIEPNRATPAELARLSPPSVSNPSDNLKNLFEVPVIFYALTIFLFVSETVDGTYVIASWLFVVFRILHSAVHCTINVIIVRFTLYIISSAILFFVLFRAAIDYLLWEN